MSIIATMVRRAGDRLDHLVAAGQAIMDEDCASVSELEGVSALRRRAEELAEQFRDVETKAARDLKQHGHHHGELVAITELNPETLRNRILRWEERSGCAAPSSAWDVEPVTTTQVEQYESFLAALERWLVDHDSAPASSQSDEDGYGVGLALYRQKQKARKGRIHPHLRERIDKILGPHWAG